jgi:site-specific recombinase XerD
VLESSSASPNDLQSYWLPFTPNRSFKDRPRLLVRGEGMYYWDKDGRKILDGISGLWCVNAGHARKPIVAAIAAQAAELDYAPSFHFAHPKVLALAARLAALAPKGLDRSDVRRLLREIELRQDVRAAAILNLLLFTGCRVSDLVKLELTDLTMSERGGSVVFRFGKGNKQRTVPLPASARQALQAYLEIRPPIDSRNVFVGERGAISDAGIRALCRKYSAIVGVRLHPHLFRHTMAKRFLESSGNDLVSLAQILGHENLQTTSRYLQRGDEQLAEAAERMQF